MTALTRFRAVRWAIPAASAAAIAVAASGVLSADATPPLPAKTAAQLLVDLQNARVQPLAGTVVQNSDLGLPALPTTGGGPRSNSSLASLLSGSHTLRIWYAGETKQRLAVLGDLGESDVVHNGRDLWLWSSETNKAQHFRLPPAAAEGTPPVGAPGARPVPLTPQEAADRALSALDPTTTVTTEGTGTVAGRPAYELVLAPKDTRSLIGQVRLAVDAATSMPLRVRVYPRASSDGPAFEVGFTRVSFERPADEQFRFSPPPGATVQEGTLSGAGDRSGRGSAAAPHAPGAGPTVIGKGWTRVFVADGVAVPAGDVAGSGQSGSAQLARFVQRLPRVSGDWGSGRLLTSTLFSALLTDDGRLLAGAVAPELLYRAAGPR